MKKLGIALRLGGKIYKEDGVSSLKWLLLSRDNLEKLGIAFERRQTGELLNLVHSHRESNKTLKVVPASNGIYFINGFENFIQISVSLGADAEWQLRVPLKIAYEESICNKNVFAKQ